MKWGLSQVVLAVDKSEACQQQGRVWEKEWDYFATTEGHKERAHSGVWLLILLLKIIT